MARVYSRNRLLPCMHFCSLLLTHGLCTKHGRKSSACSTARRILFFLKKIARYSYSKISSSKRRVDLKQIMCDFGLASQRVDILSNTISPLAFSIVQKDFIALADYFARMLECTPVHASFFFFFLFIHTLHTCKRMYVWEYEGNALARTKARFKYAFRNGARFEATDGTILRYTLLDSLG